MEFPRQEDWSGLLFPSPGDLPDLGIKPASPALVDGFFITKHQGSPFLHYLLHKLRIVALSVINKDDPELVIIEIHLPHRVVVRVKFHKRCDILWRVLGTWSTFNNGDDDHGDSGEPCFWKSMWERKSLLCVLFTRAPGDNLAEGLCYPSRPSLNPFFPVSFSLTSFKCRLF